MKKQLPALVLALVLLIAALVPAAAEDDTIPSSAGYYYVFTENGKGLNVRFTAGGEVIGSLKYGTRIYCYYRDGGNGWALIDYTYNNPTYGYGTYAAYISSRYLRKTKPEARTSGSSSKSTSSASAADAVSEINAEFRSARNVTPFTVTVRPSRTSGWVNMRWAPSKSAEIMATYKQNEKLLVIKETNNWYQVEDQDTGDVGFISKQFVVQ